MASRQRRVLLRALYAEDAMLACEDNCLQPAFFERVARYLFSGFRLYASPDGARAFMPGLSSSNGRAIDGMEGYARTAPLVAAWLYSGRAETLSDLSGTDFSLSDVLMSGVLAGTNPDHAEYWGEIEDYDQRLCEAADIALALVLAKPQVWDLLSDGAKDQIGRWLTGGLARRHRNNNWHFFPLIIDICLSRLGYETGQPAFNRTASFNTINRFAMPHGLFRDGPDGFVDYYNSWSFHYSLWIIKSFLQEDIGPVLEKQLQNFIPVLLALHSPQGFPVFGRSQHYRLGISAPLLFAAQTGSGSIQNGLALRAAYLMGCYFLANGALKSGCFTQGYHGAKPDFLDSYSGPASPLWSARTLIAYLLGTWTAKDFEAAEAARLPIEDGDFRFHLGGCGFSIIGDHQRGEIRIVNPDGLEVPPRMEPRSTLRWALNRLRGLPYRQPSANSTVLRYGLKEYSNRNSLFF